MNSNNRQAGWTGILVCWVVLALAAATVTIVLQHLGVRPRIDDAGMRALLCILLALAGARLIRTGIGALGCRAEARSTGRVLSEPCSGNLLSAVADFVFVRRPCLE